MDVEWHMGSTLDSGARDLSSIPTQDDIFLETLISLLYDNGLQSLFL